MAPKCWSAAWWNRARRARPSFWRAGCALPLAQVRAYIRGAPDPALVRQAVEGRFGPVPMVMLRGDICRSDLLVELEGLAVGGPA